MYLSAPPSALQSSGNTRAKVKLKNLGEYQHSQMLVPHLTFMIAERRFIMTPMVTQIKLFHQGNHSCDMPQLVINTNGCQTLLSKHPSLPHNEAQIFNRPNNDSSNTLSRRIIPLNH